MCKRYVHSHQAWLNMLLFTCYGLLKDYQAHQEHLLGHGYSFF